MPGPTRIEVNDELLDRLTQAALENLRDMLNMNHEHYGRQPYEDDPGDYLSAALELTRMMYDLTALSTNDTQSLDIFLNTPVDYDVAEIDLYKDRSPFAPDLHRFVTPLWQLASDGIPAAFYDLNCPALPEED